jgi:hypothetical protein
VHADTISDKTCTQASSNWGWTEFLQLDKLTQPEQGFLVDDTVVVRVDMTVQVRVGQMGERSCQGEVSD